METESENVVVETDYLIVGAGACGLAFADTLVAEAPDVAVTVIDRQPAQAVTGCTRIRSFDCTPRRRTTG